ncbi:murein DD-endopeptidase MepM/ murein hydrolase activator NlpD [Natronospira proteinivora]|uniref:Murein DD-endopeptidase MepM/ murein hydrolase activator NlpD n=1 Tax=Natronospira proteinivora TaxID=1807133 RepID=A0ABT1G491_9GAMM|nr:M23 family metallopeptidase [Natronospira proteinivora]MCP1726114.1 murein DD-endopeptidase MepM/ murein hydrolase activator NlpD [Natronospira proteinivora]
MNIIVWTKGGSSRQFNLATPGNLALLTVGLLFFSGLIALGSFFAAQTYFTEAPDERAQRLQAELAQERARIEILESESERKIVALNTQLGVMQAQVTRLNALGERLTRMAGLEEGEFNFGAMPPLGGPEEPLGAGSLGDEEANLGVEERVQDLANQISDRDRQLGVLENLLMNRNVQDRVKPQGRPIEGGWVSSGYGSRTDPFSGRRAWHGGIDFAGHKGTDVMAVAAGVVTWSGDRYGYGLMVEVNHGNGYVTRYAHNKENLVSVGDMVQKGDVIALLGQTGRATGPHVHFEVHQNGRSVNPAEYIRADN